MCALLAAVPVQCPMPVAGDAAFVPLSSASTSDSKGARDSGDDAAKGSCRMVVLGGCQNTKVISSALDIPCASARDDSPVVPSTVKWHVYGGHYGFVYAVALRKLPAPATSAFHVSLSQRFLSYHAAASAHITVQALFCTILQPARESPARLGRGDSGMPHVYTPATARYQLLTGSGDGTIGLWNVQPDTWELQYASRLEGHTGSVYALVIAGTDLYSGVWVWVLVPTLPGLVQRTCACASTGSQDGTIRVWDLETTHCKQVLTGHKEEVLCLAVCHSNFGGPGALYGLGRDGSVHRRQSAVPLEVLCSGSADGTIKLWSMRTYTCMHVRCLCLPVEILLLQPQLT